MTTALKFLSLSAILSCTLPSVAQAQTADDGASLIEALKKPQPWTDKTGRVFMATAKSMDKDSVVFLRSGGQQVTVRLEQLSEISLIALRHAFGGMTMPAAPVTTAAAPAAAVSPTTPATPAAATAPMTPIPPATTGGLPPTVQADDIKALRAALNTDVSLEGKVRNVSVSNSGHARINFEGTNDFIIFVQKRNVDASPDWNFDTLKGIPIRITGKVVEYNGTLEIVAERPDQIIRLQ